MMRIGLEANCSSEFTVELHGAKAQIEDLSRQRQSDGPVCEVEAGRT